MDDGAMVAMPALKAFSGKGSGLETITRLSTRDVRKRDQ